MRKEHRIPFLCLLTIFIVFTIGAINPIYRDDWLTESLLIFIFIPILVLTYNNFRFSNTAYILITIFFILHIIGSHYTYSEVPIGFWLQNLLGLARNHYDRIVHLLWGVLLYLPAFEICSRNISPKSKGKSYKSFFYYLIPALVLITLGALFEVVEWIVAINVSPEIGLAYLGVQGDIWDMQKDLFLKIISSAAMAFFFYIKKK